MCCLISLAIPAFAVCVGRAAVAALALPFLLVYAILVERKVVADAQARLGSARTYASGLLQPIVNSVKLVLREITAPAATNRRTLWIAPLISVAIAVLAYSVVSVGPAFRIADVNVGLVFIFGVGSLGIYGMFLTGWTSQGRDGMLEALRGGAQLASYGTPSGLALISALTLAGSLSMTEIVQAQLDRGQWFVFYVPVGFFIYFIASLVAANLAPFDVLENTSIVVDAPNAESEGLRRSLYFFAEHSNSVIAAAVATTVFLGGWLRPLASYRDHFPGTNVELLDVIPGAAAIVASMYCLKLAPKQPTEIQRRAIRSLGLVCMAAAAALVGVLFAPDSVTQAIHGAFWFLLKVGAYIYCFSWIRLTFPRYDFDELMSLAWNILIPLAFVNMVTGALAIVASQNLGLPMRLTTLIATALTVAAGVWFLNASDSRAAAQVADGE
jgi:NADH-quinone oxidoreductase subunit H